MSDIVAKANHVVAAFSQAIGYKGEARGTCASVYPDDMATLKALVVDAVEQGAKEVKAAAENELAFSRQLIAAQSARIEQLRVDLDRAAGEIGRLQSGSGKSVMSATELMRREMERMYGLNNILNPPPQIIKNKVTP